MQLWASVLSLLIAPVLSDIYLHNPRGSNNRLHESGRARTNANRLFDSQNNNRGGYNVGSLYYYAGSTLPIEWTNQHSCGDPNNHCTIVLQYMCNSDVRDGVSLGTIPEEREKCAGGDCQTDFQYGMHESYESHLRCSRRQRNGGLFVADSRLRGDTAVYTRQNQNGNRYGYECAEERDYYPYWASSEWKDIAVLTDSHELCSHMRSSSANVQSRGECRLPTDLLERNSKLALPLNRSACESVSVEGVRAEWKILPAWNLTRPECRQVEWTRDNHLGNTIMGESVQYNWTVPTDAVGANCILRIRYNVSTADYNHWSTYSDTAVTPVSGRGNLSSSRGYQFKNNPTVKIFADAPQFGLQLQINTAQYGRVFQDRSHVFRVRERPNYVPQSARIVNLNVRGKRGNIVQVYPSVEYDFIPRQVFVSPGEFVHHQWTGSNGNNNGNDGQGRAGTDRSNVVPLLGNDLATNLVGNETLGWLSESDAVAMATLNPPQLGGDLQWLDDAGTNFDLGIRRVTSTGDWAFLSTRNNDFSNRSHKGRLVSASRRPHTIVTDVQGGKFDLLDGRVTLVVSSDAFDGVVYLQVELHNDTWSGSLPNGDTWFTEFLHFTCSGACSFNSEVAVTLATVKSPSEGHDVHVFRYESASPTALGYRTPDTVNSNFVTFRTRRPGVFGVRGFESGPTSVIGIVVGVLIVVVLLAIVTAIVVQHRRNPTFFTEKFRYLRRSGKTEV